MNSAEYYIRKLQLQPHPEGGYYREIYRNPDILPGEIITRYPKKRNLSTSIYFLLRSGDRSNFHRLASDELWYFHTGSPVRIHTISVNGDYSYIDLGMKDPNPVFQVIISSGTIFGAEVKTDNSYSLLGCMVSPGFDFDDFELLERSYLLSEYPNHKEIIEKFTNDSSS